MDRVSRFVAAVGFGLVLVTAAAAAEGLLYPVSLGSEGSCQLGGTIATMTSEMRAAGVRLRGLEEYRAGLAVAPDLVGTGLARLEEGVAAGIEEAGVTGTAAALASLASRHAFTFVDVWLTDGYGHARDAEGAARFLVNLDALLALLLTEGTGAVSSGATVVITSDHGNLEDLSVKGHTRNPVPLLVLGQGAHEFETATSLLDVAPAVRRVLGL